MALYEMQIKAWLKQIKAWFYTCILYIYMYAHMYMYIHINVYSEINEYMYTNIFRILGAVWTIEGLLKDCTETTACMDIHIYIYP